jgi:hypothetical protein
MPSLKKDIAALCLSPFVVQARMPVLLAETLRNPFDRPETERMWSEKIAAFQESWWAVSLAASQNSISIPALFSPALFSPAGLAELGKSARHMSSAAVRPMASRVQKNAQRLKRR